MNNSKYKLINVEKKDINKIYDIGKNNLDIYYDKNHLNYFITNKNYKMFKVIFENNICAFVICEIINDNKLHINSIAVDKKYRRIGIGSFMLSSIKNKFNYKYITLYVSVKNTKAINLYKKNKFKINKKINNYYYTLNEDAFVMYYNKNDYKLEGFKNNINNYYSHIYIFLLILFIIYLIS